MPIDLYCERTGPGFWNEPVNALTNLAFILAAGVAWRAMSMRGHADRLEQGVIVLAGSIGVGSFLFHTYAERWAEQADVLPIWCFAASFVLLTVYRFTGQDIMRTGRIAVVALVAASLIVSVTGGGLIPGADDQALPLNGSLQYAPALVALLVFTAIARWRGHPTRRHFLMATLIFCLALFFRSIDLLVCTATGGIGTHFLWHILNALMIGILLQALVTKMPPLIGYPKSR